MELEKCLGIAAIFARTTNGQPVTILIAVDNAGNEVRLVVNQAGQIISQVCNCSGKDLIDWQRQFRRGTMVYRGA